MIPILFSVAAIAFALFSTPSYEASASLVCNDPSGAISAGTLVATVSPLAQNNAQATEGSTTVQVIEPPANAAAAKAGVLTFTASGSTPDACIDVVNYVVKQTANEALALFSELEEDFEGKYEKRRAFVSEVLEGADSSTEALIAATIDENDFSHCTFTAVEATKAVSKGLGVQQMFAIGLGAGVLCSLGFCLAIYALKAPLMSRRQLEQQTDLPILVWPSCTNAAALLWANICFACEGAPASIALVALSDEAANHVSDELALAIKGSGRDVLTCKNFDERNPSNAKNVGMDNLTLLATCSPLISSVDAAQLAHQAQGTIVCVRQWRDRSSVLDDILTELKLANASIIGVALLAENGTFA